MGDQSPTSRRDSIQPCLTAEAKCRSLSQSLLPSSSSPPLPPRTDPASPGTDPRAVTRTGTRPTPGSSRATRPLTLQPGELLWVPAPNTLPTRCSTHAGTGAAPGTATPRGPTTGSLAIQTLTTGSLDSSEVSLQPPWLRMLDSPPTAGKEQQQGGGELHSL